jgi:SIR2-like protein
VVIYKIHGCLYPKLKREEADGVIISDNDYVSYIKQMGKGSSVIPSNVNTLINNKPFVFLGYSLNDWNIRSSFETMREKRSQFGGVQDFSVMYDVGEYEEVFFQRNDILIFKTDLNSFVDGIINALPEAVKASVLE